MNAIPDITFTLAGDDFGYRVTTQSGGGASFVAAHLPEYKADDTLPASEARAVADRAEACALVVRIE